MSRDELLKEYPNLKDFLPLLDQLNKESERGAVLLACSYIEDQLEDIITSFLIDDTTEYEKLFHGLNAPLGALSSRATMAYCLGLINKSEFAEIDILKKIRNAFAHNYKASFEDQKIKDLCNNLSYSAKDYGEVVVGTFGKFNTSSVALILNLTNRPHYVKQKKLKRDNWPY